MMQAWVHRRRSATSLLHLDMATAREKTLFKGRQTTNRKDGAFEGAVQFSDLIRCFSTAGFKSVTLLALDPLSLGFCDNKIIMRFSRG